MIGQCVCIIYIYIALCVRVHVSEWVRGCVYLSVYARVCVCVCSMFKGVWMRWYDEVIFFAPGIHLGLMELVHLLLNLSHCVWISESMRVRVDVRATCVRACVCVCVCVYSWERQPGVVRPHAHNTVQTEDGLWWPAICLAVAVTRHYRSMSEDVACTRRQTRQTDRQTDRQTVGGCDKKLFAKDKLFK